MSSLLIESQYLPCIEYFSTLSSTDKVILEYHENYQKQSYRNRCRIMTSQGLLELYIPILKTGAKMLMKDVKIDYSQKWLKDHWRAIQSAYGNAPFFEHYGFYFEHIYSSNPKYLVDLNLQFIMTISKLLKLDQQLLKSKRYQHDPEEGVLDWRSKIHPKKALKNNPFYKPCNYNQIFGKKFAGNLSIIDLIFCEGPSARKVLSDSRP